MVKHPIDQYLLPCEFIDFSNAGIQERAAQLSRDSVVATAKACFEFVRDEIRHSWDAQDSEVTIRASHVLEAGTGYCYAKSHLLAALLRANGVPAALCYQRLSLEGSGALFCLHGLNAVYLPDTGWYRCDARGNKAGVDAQFTPGVERLAFPLQETGEVDFPTLYAEPLPVVIKAMQKQSTVQALYQHLPDAEPFQLGF